MNDAQIVLATTCTIGAVGLAVLALAARLAHKPAPPTDQEEDTP